MNEILFLQNQCLYEVNYFNSYTQTCHCIVTYLFSYTFLYFLVFILLFLMFLLPVYFIFLLKGDIYAEIQIY